MRNRNIKEVALTELSLPDVLQIMVAGSGKTWEDVAAVCGWTTANVNRIRDPKQDYWPTLPRLASFCAACHSTLVLDWIDAQAEIGGVELELDAMDCAGLVASLGGLFKEMGDVAKAGDKALRPEGDKGCGISQAEARTLIRELIDLINKCNEAISRLRPIAGKPGDRF